MKWDRADNKDMERFNFSILIIAVLALLITGCPKKKPLPAPDPGPPEPQVVRSYEELKRGSSEAPPAGLRYEYRRMLA